MFVQYVRATAISLAFVWAMPAFSQDTEPSETPAFSADAVPSGEDSYVADPSESFVVEHSGSVAAVAPRAAPPGQRCREYTTDERGAYGRGLACPQPDGSWRIVSGPEGLADPRARDSAPEYPDYTDDMDDGARYARPTRRFRLDWGAWNTDSFRRNAPRSYRYRYDE